MREKIRSLEEFRALQEKYVKARSCEKRKVLVCCGTGCAAGGGTGRNTGLGSGGL